MPAEGTELPSVGAEIAGKYRIESVLGQGGMGAVFAARNKLTGKRVAIKWLLPEHAGSTTRERLLREAQIAASIEHPNVVDIYDVGEHEGGLFLVMEYLRGKPLSDVLTQVGRMEPELLIALLIPAMRGVQAAHAAGVIHRDLKPDNIILSEQDGRVVPKVVDFGVSKTVGASAMPASSLTRTGALIGTPHYMALEQVDGSNDIDIRTDVYAFGVLLYRALTGHFPHDGATLGEVILKIGTKDAPPMRSLHPELPAALDNVILRALARERGKRYRDLEELARALAPFTSMRPGEPIDVALLPKAARSNAPPSQHSQEGAMLARPTPPFETRRRRTRAMFAGAVLALASLGAAAWLSKREPVVAPIAEKPVALEVPKVAAVEAPPVQPPVAAPIAPAPAELVPEPPAALAEDVKPLKQDNVALAVKPAASSARADKPRERKSNKVVRANKSAAPSMIPGERTNGLATDDF
jgi:serine/threonine protein kinase